jgi:hypothetical protein
MTMTSTSAYCEARDIARRYLNWGVCQAHSNASARRVPCRTMFFSVGSSFLRGFGSTAAHRPTSLGWRLSLGFADHNCSVLHHMSIRESYLTRLSSGHVTYSPEDTPATVLAAFRLVKGGWLAVTA